MTHRPRRSRLVPLAAVLAVLGALLALIWIGPGLLDWSKHREAVESAASELIGRQVDIDGAIHLSLLPQPSISAEKVSVRGETDGVRLAARTLTLNLSLGALITGRIAVTHLALDHPDLRLPWPLPEGPTSVEPPPWLSTLSADITNGTVSIGRLTITHADFSVTTGAVANALTIDGTAQAAGLGWKGQLSLGWPEADGAAALRIALQGPDSPASSFELAGRMTPQGVISGQFSAHGAKLSALLPGPPVAFDAYGRMQADGRRLRFTGLRLNLGDVAAEGEGDLRLGPPAAGRGGAATSGSTAARASPPLHLSLHTPMFDLSPWLASFPKASQSIIPMALTLDADSAIYGQGLMRHFSLRLETSSSAVKVNALQATLPGEADITLAGLYDPDAALFRGAIKLAAPSPLVTLHWLAAAHGLPDVSGALLGLRTLALDANLFVDPKQVALTTIDGTMNDTALSGGLAITRGAVPRISAGLALGRIDLDTWLPPAWIADPPGPDALARALGGIAADLRLTARQVWIAGARVDDALLDADLGSRGLNLRQFAGRYGGMQILASGVLNPKGAVQDGRLVLAAPDAAPLAALLPAPARALSAAFRHQPLALTLTGSGPVDRLQLALQGKLGDLMISAQPLLDLPRGSWKGVLTLQHPSARRLLALIGFDAAGSWLGEGSLSLVGNLAYGQAGWSVSPLTFSLGQLHGSARLAEARGAEKILGAIAIDSLPWPQPDADQPLPLSVLSGWQASLGITAQQVVQGLRPLARKVQAYADLTQGVLRLSIAHAAILGGAANGTIRLTSADPPQLSLDLALRGAHLASPAADTPAPSLVDWLPIALTAQRLDAQIGLTAEGYSLNSWRASLGGRVGFIAEHGSLGGIDLAGAAPAPVDAGATPGRHAPGAAVFTGATPFDEFGGSGSVALGNLSITSMSLSGPAGAISIGGQVDLVRGTCTLALALRPHSPAAGGGAAAGEPPPLTAVLQGPIGRPAASLVQGMAPGMATATATAQGGVPAPGVAEGAPSTPGKGTGSGPAAARTH
ncbi:AsmA family protein [Acidisoma sp. C75]